jgi:hypothetical protein
MGMNMNFFARLKEPSTHAALAGLAGLASQVAVAQGADPAIVTAVGGALSGIFGLLGVFLGEKSAPAAQ